MRRVEDVLESDCHQCGFKNELGCEVEDDPFCTGCGAALIHEALVEYIDNCPVCEASFDEGKPFVFRKDVSGLTHWLCRSCQTSPRGMFYQEFEQAQGIPKHVPECQLCGEPSRLLVLTHASDDGVFICEPCSSTQVGLQMLKEHYESEA